MSSDGLLMGLAVVMVVVAVVGMGFTYFSVSNVKQSLTGFATDTAVTNLSVTATAAINFTTDFINFGTGYVSEGYPFGVLSSQGEKLNVTNFNTVTNGFVLENIGNVNVTLDIKTGANAAGFLGGTSPAYKFNVSNSEAGSCARAGTVALGTYTDASTSDQNVCADFLTASATDTLRVDVYLKLPSDSKTGGLTDTMTATATAL
jgi:hypothetical protein